MLKSYLNKNNIYPEDDQILSVYGQGQLFGVLVDQRVVGCVYVRIWPNSPNDGDVHILCSEKRMFDYPSVMEFMAFLRHRGRMMNLERWRVAVKTDDVVTPRALIYIGFTDTGVHPFPVMGTARILVREVS